MIHGIKKWSLRLLALLFLLVLLAYFFLWVRPINARIFYEKAFLEFALSSPQTLTSIRLLEGIGIRGHNAHLDDISIEEGLKFYELVDEGLENLQRFDRDDMEGQDVISYDMMKYFLEQQKEGKEFMYHGYPVNQMGGVQTEFPQFMTGIHHIGDGKDVEHYISRLHEAPRYFAQLLDGLKANQERDIVAPRFAVEKVISEIDRFAGVDVKENALYENLKTKLDEKTSLSDEEKAAFLGEAQDAITQSVYPAYAQLKSYLVELLDVATSNHGVWALPDGDRYYQYRLDMTTTTNYSADQIHQIGLKEVDRILIEMNELLNQVEMTEGTVGQRMRTLSEDPQFLYPNTDEGREQILKDYAAQIKEIEAGMDEIFDLEIEAAVEVQRVPEYREEGSAGAYYMRPASDGSRPGVFYANLRDLNEHPKWGMRTLAYHEAIPGHHYQLAIMTELQGVPEFRKFLSFTSYTEGWALYAERLAYEAGFHADPYSNLGRLQAELWRAVRLVVDTGLHHKRWTREKAIDYMAATTGIKESDVITEIERYLVWPGQATAYKVGMLKIMELRERAQRSLGDSFDIKAFHRAVLENGAVPLFVLEQQIDAYIAKNLP